MVEKPALPYDPRLWHNIQPPEVMDAARRFEYDEDSLALVRRWLRLDSVKTVVEVGCGSGFFTEKLRLLAPEAELVGVEPDEPLRRYA